MVLNKESRNCLRCSLLVHFDVCFIFTALGVSCDGWWPCAARVAKNRFAYDDFCQIWAIDDTVARTGYIPFVAPEMSLKNIGSEAFAGTAQPNSLLRAYSLLLP